MPWIYQVTETISDPYDYYNASTKMVTFGTTPDGEGFLTISETATPITNSLKTSVTFQKKWVDEDNKEISTDYFGEVTVDFKLQVSTDETKWNDIPDFFTNDEEPAGGEPAEDGKVYVSPEKVWDLSKEGTYQGSVTEANDWKHTFSNPAPGGEGWQ